MRFALATLPVVVASLLYACATFSSSDPAPAPANDAAVDTAPPVDECKPVIVDPSSAPECSEPLTTATNCGACGHACLDSPCLEGRCVAERITENEVSAFAVDGTSLYFALGNDIQHADLTQHPPTIDLFFQPIFGSTHYLEAYAGKLWVSTTEQPTVIDLITKEQGGNPHFAPVNTMHGEGTFFPGRIAYYLYPGEGGFELARIDTSNDGVRYKKASSFVPVSRTGDELFWTEVLSTGRQIWGAWDEDQKPVASVGADLKAFAADGTDAYLVAGGFVRRARNGTFVDIAKEAGVALSMAVSGNDLFYLVQRSVPAEERYQVWRVDKCRGGRPVLVYESVNSALTRVIPDGTSHVIIGGQLGLFRVAR